MAKELKTKFDLSVNAYDELFMTDDQRAENRLPKIHSIPLSQIVDFPDHPYRVLDDEDMNILKESIQERGLITPVTVRQTDENQYEMISGHRRKRACELLGMESIDANDLYLPIEETKEFFGQMDYVLPYSRPIKQQTITGTLSEKLHDKKRLEKAKTTAEQNAEDGVKNTAKDTMKRNAKGSETAAKGSVKTSERMGKTVKNTSHAAQSTGKTVKTAEQATKTAVKTAKATAKAAQKAAEASAKTSRKAAEAAKQAGIAAYKAAVAVGKAIVAACKAIAAGISKLVAAIGAGGAIAVIIIIVLCLIGGVLGSCFGLFASNEKASSDESTQTMREVILEINQEYQGKLDSITDSVSYDKLEMSGSRAVWPEVLTIYAVKTNTDTENPQEVATINDEKKQLLKNIFWEMNSINYDTEKKTHKEPVESAGSDGEIITSEIEVTEIYLYITVTHKTAEEMCSAYSFSDYQESLVTEMLAIDSSLWTGVLYGVYSTDEAIVTVALSQVGNVGGQPYWSWYGFSSRVEWCACFVSWCANECGYIDSGIIPKYAGCVNGVEWFKSRGQWLDGSATPEAGMIIFYDWDSPNGESGPQDGSSDHTGIVWKVENGIIYTIEGNSGDSCRIREHPVGYYEILGYGVPNY